MGVVAKPNPTPNSSKTSELADWISLIKVKKLNFKSKNRNNLLIEAVLNKALSRAETELRQKQQERRLRWQHLKSRWAIRNDCCDKNSNASVNWDTKICEELSSYCESVLCDIILLWGIDCQAGESPLLVCSNQDVPEFCVTSFEQETIYFLMLDDRTWVI
ncbi:hypothetical protein NQ315_009592 [Exocentrus adspersus]|uniref:Uncharacterized protein n=1 Tax=Exocentrus adspersus TaxID=1586481 RepID=A0AAV8WGQ7_9CUCU|nr:hypothetical protein NQ315_009592 [Exocentrus adspersus]